MLGGRVKTLHPKVHGGIMYVRGNAEHEASIAEAGIKGIDLVVLNLYAFEATVAKGSDFATCVENVDIGGPSMLRSSAKNHAYVAIATSPDQYGALTEAMDASGGATPYALRKRFAAAAGHSAYGMIASWFAGQVSDEADGPAPADPLCSFGDFVALSDVVDVKAAEVLKKEVSGGVIAPGFDDDALAILSAKKGGKFVCKRNDRAVTLADVATDSVSGGAMPADAQRDLVLASIACKYTQSNSIVFAKGGGVSDALLDLPLARASSASSASTRVKYIEGGLGGQSPQEKGAFDALFASGAAPPELTPAQKAAILKTLDGVSLSSDAFFPFPDNIDVAAKFGVKYIAQAGGSVQDAQVIDAAKGYGMMMAMTGLRLFHH
ncbi:IMP cyclohydrolase [Aureococcus anophagefferens]|nr:IMP cyclohydrolase [Aureococcus anophagefferens]